MGVFVSEVSNYVTLNPLCRVVQCDLKSSANIMKRARKYPIKPDPIATNPIATNRTTPGLTMPDLLGTSQPKNVQSLWIGYASDQNELETELDWVRTSLELQFNVNTTLVNQSSDAGTQVAQWLERNHLTNAASPVFISSRYRSDNLVEVINSLKSNLRDCEVYCILGQWWVGHKRTLPLPLGNPVFYWYELYDSLLPEINRSQQPARLLDFPTSSRAMSESALICSNNPELRRMWGESLQHHGIHTVALIDLDAIPESHFNYILVDADSNHAANPSVDCDLVDCDLVDTQRLERLPQLVATLRRRYPKSVIATLMGFPEWQSSQAVLQSGANMIVGKPCRVAGLVSSLRSFMMQ